MICLGYLDKNEKVLNTLKNTKLKDIGRCANMLWLIFEKNGDQYAVHVQCSWRIADVLSILLADGDIYYSISEDVEWNVQGNSIFDIISAKIKNQDLYVAECSLKGISDLCICFQNGWSFYAFYNNSIEEEQWRIFLKDSPKEHMVARGTKIVFE